MAKLLISVCLVVALVGIFADAFEVYPTSQASFAAGGAGGKYQNTEMGSENHDKKQGSISFSSDKGSSNNYKNTAAAAGIGGMAAQGSAPVYPGWAGWPQPQPGGWGWPQPPVSPQPGAGWPQPPVPPQPQPGAGWPQPPVPPQPQPGAGWPQPQLPHGGWGPQIPHGWRPQLPLRAPSQ